MLVYVAGHGRELDGQAVIVPMDATLDSLEVTGIRVDYIQSMLQNCKAEQKVLMLDTCHSGAGRDVSVMGEAFLQQIDQGKGIYTLASCDRDQISYEWEEQGQGAFTYFLVESILRGAPANALGQVPLDSVYQWTREKVSHWAASRRLRQEPVRIVKTHGDIMIGSRQLTVEEKLQQAQEEIVSLKKTVGTQQAEVVKLHKQLAEKDKKSVRDRKRGGKKSNPVDWKTWQKREQIWAVENSGPFRLFIFVFLFIGLVVGFGGMIERNITAIMVAFSLIFVGIIWYFALHTWFKSQYRMHCVEHYLNNNDCASAMAVAEQMGRWGIEGSAGAALVIQAAECARENGDHSGARAMYKLAHKRWKSPHALRELNNLDS